MQLNLQWSRCSIPMRLQMNLQQRLTKLHCSRHLCLLGLMQLHSFMRLLFRRHAIRLYRAQLPVPPVDHREQSQGTETASQLIVVVEAVHVVGVRVVIINTAAICSGCCRNSCFHCTIHEWSQCICSRRPITIGTASMGLLLLLWLLLLQRILLLLLIGL